MKALIPSLLAVVTLTAASPVIADVLLIEAIAQEPAALSRPTNGQSMDRVRQNFGAPIEEVPAVGEPPISRWRYDDFTVFFEYNLVINSVVHR